MLDVWRQTTASNPMQCRISTPRTRLFRHPYTQAVEVSDVTRTLYISGQVGQRVDGTIPDDIVEQAASLGKILKRVSRPPA
jgi:enamine deaminase RidA (YjgF/YER057c/UK114 family)